MPYIELHLHTKAGSADSSITVDQLGERATAQGTGALIVTEHFRVWSDWEREAFQERWGILLYPGIEVTTDLGHTLLVGVEPETRLPGETEVLLAMAADKGWFAVAAHPFRQYFDTVHGSQRPPFEQGLTAAQLAEHPYFGKVDAIEVANGGSTDRENALALNVASLLGKPVTAGSDAHHVDEVGRERMDVPALPSDVAELAELLRSATAG
ncbi:MAG TPA: PHP-associated domain-containing protein [Dehalococcoidia bacterium]|nr:PHP-associated domain-containing protein [Dehalococcoidia bacterium]